MFHFHSRVTARLRYACGRFPEAHPGGGERPQEPAQRARASEGTWATTRRTARARERARSRAWPRQRPHQRSWPRERKGALSQIREGLSIAWVFCLFCSRSHGKILLSNSLWILYWKSLLISVWRTQPISVFFALMYKAELKKKKAPLFSKYYF